MRYINSTDAGSTHGVPNKIYQIIFFLKVKRIQRQRQYFTRYGTFFPPTWRRWKRQLRSDLRMASYNFRKRGQLVSEGHLQEHQADRGADVVLRYASGGGKLVEPAKERKKLETRQAARRRKKENRKKRKREKHEQENLKMIPVFWT